MSIEQRREMYAQFFQDLAVDLPPGVTLDSGRFHHRGDFRIDGKPAGYLQLNHDYRGLTFTLKSKKFSRPRHFTKVDSLKASIKENIRRATDKEAAQEAAEKAYYDASDRARSVKGKHVVSSPDLRAAFENLANPETATEGAIQMGELVMRKQRLHRYSRRVKPILDRLYEKMMENN